MSYHRRVAIAALAFAMASPLAGQEARPVALAAAPDTASGPVVQAVVATQKPATARPAVSYSAAGATVPRLNALASRSATATRNAAAYSPNSHNEAMMIVGGAAILVGVLVEGDAGRLISVAGAVVGLIGLYQYLQ